MVESELNKNLIIAIHIPNVIYITQISDSYTIKIKIILQSFKFGKKFKSGLGFDDLCYGKDVNKKLVKVGQDMSYIWIK